MSPLWWRQAISEAEDAAKAAEAADELARQAITAAVAAKVHARNVRLLLESHEPVPQPGEQP